MQRNFLTHFDAADLNVATILTQPKRKSKGAGKKRDRTGAGNVPTA